MKLGLWALGAGFLFLSSTLSFAEDPAPDPFLAPDANATPAPALPPPDSSGSGSSTSTAAATEAGTAAPAPTPAEQAPIPVSSLPGKTDKSPVVAAPPKDVYEEYEEYRARLEDKETDEDRFETRARFAHEGGGWQIGLEYIHRAFGDYNWNFNPAAGQLQGTNPVRADTQGLMVSFGYFPLRSLTFGRLGALAQGGVYVSKFSLDTPQFNATGQQTNTVRDDAKRQSGMSYGVRAVYEFQYFIGQLFVPFVTAGVDMVRINPYRVAVIAGNTGAERVVVDIPANSITSQSYGAGVHFNLNRVEPVVGSRGLVNVGVRKFYLTYLALQRSGTLSGLTHSLGLRFEF